MKNTLCLLIANEGRRTSNAMCTYIEHTQKFSLSSAALEMAFVTQQEIERDAIQVAPE
jgi:hypothetical protein